MFQFSRSEIQPYKDGFVFRFLCLTLPPEYLKMGGLALCMLLLAAPAVTRAQGEHGEGVVESLQADVAQIREALKTLAMQLKSQQMDVEDRTRTSGHSGLTLTRSSLVGCRPFEEDSFIGRTSVANMHNHPDHKRTIGLGDFSAVLNGVHFLTRHNDYGLYMTNKTTKGHKAILEEIPFPDVPPAVLSQSTVEDQITEMREWFRAFQEQDWSVRDYRDYFPAVVCYLEATWFYSDFTDIEDGFHSDRHDLNATSFNGLRSQAHFCAQTGHKHEQENVATLPSSIVGYDDNGNPILAQWNYRILCHPIGNLQTNRFRLVDDLKARAKKDSPNLRTLEAFKKSRASRFKLNLFNNNTECPGELRGESYIENLMYKIYGYDNFGWKADDVYDSNKYRANGGTNNLNCLKYHTKYLIEGAAANGDPNIPKGFNDPNCFFAMTTDEDVVEQEMTICNKNGNNCKTWKQRWSYAFPLEIIYLTPLLSWNPYNLVDHGVGGTPEGDVAEKDVNGTKLDGTLDHPFNGTNSRNYRITPEGFYTGSPTGDDADTSTGKGEWVLDPQGVPRKVCASGTWIHLPSINGLDADIRLRYPIFPIHAEGSVQWKELDALKATVQDQRYDDLRYNETTT